ncbi:MAG TPA: sensor histidine kinase [Kofleriaceae bacterium]|nr:sensor histidine kinase [Kofleriaceae bacterium]
MHELSTFIRTHRGEIIAAWLARVQQLPSATDQSLAVLRDSVPAILDRIMLELDHAPPDAHPIHELATAHAIDRYRKGYDVREVIAEYQLLQVTIEDLYFREGGLPPDVVARLRSLQYVGAALDDAVAVAVDCYVRERDSLRDVFVGILGHDLRAPLQAILAAADLLIPDDELEGGAAPDPTRVAERIKRYTFRMARMIDQLLDYTRGRLGGGIPVARAPVDLVPLVANIVDEHAAAHPDRSLSFTAPPARGGVVGEWDGARLEQLVSNLVQNALQHGADPITVDLLDDGDAVRLVVTNAGEMPREVQIGVFEPFRAPARKGSLGLGLFIVREIARAHGGEVRVDSNAGVGTRFTVRLPKAAVAPLPLPPRPGPVRHDHAVRP